VVRNDLEQAQDRIRAMESSRLHAESQFRATVDQMQQEIGRLELEKNEMSARSVGAQIQAVAVVRNDLEQAQDRIRAMESSRSHAESQFRATVDQMQQEIGRLELGRKESLAHAVSQARLISMSQNDLEQVQSQIRFFESNEVNMRESMRTVELQNQALEAEIMKLKEEHSHDRIDAIAKTHLAATFEQACTYIRDLGSDQEISMANFKAALQQMQGSIDSLEVEKRNALAQIASQATLIATAHNDLENTRLQMSELVSDKHDAADSGSIIALLQDKADKLTMEKNDALERTASLVHLMEVTRLSLEKSRRRIAELESQNVDVTMLSHDTEQLQKTISTLQLEKQSALADLERLREETAAKDLKSYARFYALQRLSLQNQSAKMEKCHIENFSVNIDPKHALSTQRQHSNARFQTQGVLSEIGIRSRRQCHALSIMVPAESESHRHFIYAYFMIAWAQFVTASKFHRKKMSIQTFRVKNRSTYFILKMRRKFLVAQFFTIWKANSAIFSQGFK